MLKSRTIAVSIERPADEVYAFLLNPENIPTWATSFCKSVRRSGDKWIIETPGGQMTIQFVEKNRFRVLDHVVTLPNGQEILNPMRVLTNGNGSEVIFTLFQTVGVSDEQFAADASTVEADLATLKSVLER